MPGGSVAVLDIDGVVADVRHRLHYIEGARRDWDRFFRAAGRDPLLAEGGELARLLAAEHDIVWLTGRPEWLRALTAEWLTAHELPGGRLVLRGNRDHRPAVVLKLAAIRTLATDFDIAAAVDDDPDVIDALVAAGFPAVRADWVPRARGDALYQAQDRDGVS